MAKNIPAIKVGNETYELKDLTAREHLFEVSNTQPTSVDNKIWVKETEVEYSVPTNEEFLQLQARVGTLGTVTKIAGTTDDYMLGL